MVSLALAIAVVMMNVIDTTSANITASISIVDRYMINLSGSVRNPNDVWTWLSLHGTIVCYITVRVKSHHDWR